jgi:uncharacterized repeat protein (TIGR03943 family)
VTRAAGPILVLVTGAVTLRLTVFGDFVNYVKPSHQGWLLATGAGLMILGLVGLVRAIDARAVPEEPAESGRRVHTHGPLRADPALAKEVRARRQEERAHDHTRAPGIAWLLCLPLFLALLVPPPPLGAFAAARGGAIVAKPPGGKTFPALATGDPVPLPVYDYAERAVWDQAHTLNQRTVVLTGFVTPKPDGGWYLTRMRITCCAADARSYLVEAAGPVDDYPPNTWLTITGTVASSTSPDVARIEVATAIPTDQPHDPYEQ